MTRGGAGDSWARIKCAGGGVTGIRCTELLAADIILSLPCSPRSCDKKLLKLGWQEKTSWEEGLRKTVDWYLQNANREYWCAAAAGAGGQVGSGSRWRSGTLVALPPTHPLLECHPFRRSHGDMELALDAHPTLQQPVFGSANLAVHLA